MNGISLNGISLNGISVNGISVNGIGVNGATPGGTTPPASQSASLYPSSRCLQTGDPADCNQLTRNPSITLPDGSIYPIR